MKQARPSLRRSVASSLRRLFVPPVPTIRLATEADLAIVNAIHNHYIEHTTVTYLERPFTMEERVAWFRNREPRHPVTVAELDDVVVGWGALLPFRAYSAYRFTCENSVYVHPDHHRRGVGSALLADTIDRAAAFNFHSILAVIDGDQAPSVALHARHGFEHVGRFDQIGFKFDRWLDVIFMQRMVRPRA